jgi:small subunit ribosomal protein S16
MEVRIRMQKAGKTANKRYNYRIVAISRATARQGRHLEIIGYYDPARKPAVISVNQEKLNKWLEKGASMSDTVRSLVRQVKRQGSAA